MGKTLIRYFGGKNKHVGDYLKLLPPHKYYLEVFGGSGALLFNKQPSKVEVYNDINRDLFNLFCVLRDREMFKEFQRLCSLTLWSRDEFLNALEALKHEEDMIKRAWAFWISIVQSFSGQGEAYAVAIYHNEAKTYFNRVQGLEYFHLRLQNVIIENKDWRELLDIYDYKYEEEVVFLDPPYYPDTRKGGRYKYEMSKEQHEELIEYLLTHKRRVILCGYENDLYEELTKAGWHKIVFIRNCSAVGKTRYSGRRGTNKTSMDIRRDCVWINFDPNRTNML